jgi:uncharacterized damage-inducible protein DinB
MKRSLALLSVIALAVLAGAALPRSSSSAAPGAIATDKQIWTPTIGYIQAAADQMPDSLYNYRPVATVRTFGELIAHIAGSQHMFCAAATGDKPSAEDDIEKTVKGKAALVAALKASTAYCQKAYGMSDADAANRPVEMFGMKANGMWAVLENTAHDSEHYGNIVTYMRMLGMVPPSSQPAPK